MTYPTQIQMEKFEARQHSQHSVAVRGRGKNKKFWNVREEAVLIDILLELSGTSWKTDNGYKNGYCYYVEKRMDEELPGCGLKADPHIESKIKTLRRHLTYVLDIEENGEGFWWDDEQKTVVGDKDAFLAWSKNHEGASSLYMKPFGHYDKLCEIFGKKRPSRKQARASAEALYLDPPIAYVRYSGYETQSNVREDATSITRSTLATPSEARNEKSKRSREVDPSEEFLEMSKTIRGLAEAQKELAMTMVNMKQSSIHNMEISEQRKKLFSVLMKLPGLSSVEAVKAARSIGQDDRKVEVFFSMPDVYKVTFAHIELESSE